MSAPVYWNLSIPEDKIPEDPDPHELIGIAKEHGSYEWYPAEEITIDNIETDERGEP